MLSRCIFIALARVLRRLLVKPADMPQRSPQAAQICSDTQGKEAKSMSVGHLKRWESRVFRKHWWILDDLK